MDEQDREDRIERLLEARTRLAHSAPRVARVNKELRRLGYSDQDKSARAEKSDAKQQATPSKRDTTKG